MEKVRQALTTACRCLNEKIMSESTNTFPSFNNYVYLIKIKNRIKLIAEGTCFFKMLTAVQIILSSSYTYIKIKNLNNLWDIKNIN